MEATLGGTTMNWAKTLLLGCAVVAFAGPAAAEPAASPYATMVAAIEPGKTDADYGALRRAYVESESYDPYGTKILDLVSAMRDAFSAGDCKTAAKDAETIATLQFTDIEAHMVAALCLERTGDHAKADFQHAIFLGLVHSILDSGDGLAPATAYRVVSLDEEYAVLNLLDLKVGQQALVQDSGHSYDRFTVSMADAKGEIEVFFEIDPILKALDREFQTP